MPEYGIAGRHVLSRPKGLFMHCITKLNWWILQWNPVWDYWPPSTTIMFVWNIISTRGVFSPLAQLLQFYQGSSLPHMRKLLFWCKRQSFSPHIKHLSYVGLWWGQKLSGPGKKPNLCNSEQVIDEETLLDVTVDYAIHPYVLGDDLKTWLRRREKSLKSCAMNQEDCQSIT